MRKRLRIGCIGLAMFAAMFPLQGQELDTTQVSKNLLEAISKDEAPMGEGFERSTFKLSPNWRPSKEQLRQKELEKQKQAALENDADRKKKKEQTIADSTLLTYGLRIGVDLVQPLAQLLDSTYMMSWLVNFDFRVRPKIFVAGDFGMARRKMDFTSQRAEVNGWYVKAGALYGLNNKFVERNDLLYVGGKIGVGFYDRTLSDISIKNPVWGDPITPQIHHKGLYATWFELTAGIKVDIAAGFTMGFSGSYNLMLSASKPEGIPPLIVPGMGQVYNGSSAFSFTYSLMYLIPLKKVPYEKVKPKRFRQQEILSDKKIEVKDKGTAAGPEEVLSSENAGELPEALEKAIREDENVLVIP